MLGNLFPSARTLFVFFSSLFIFLEKEDIPQKQSSVLFCYVLLSLKMVTWTLPCGIFVAVERAAPKEPLVPVALKGGAPLP